MYMHKSFKHKNLKIMLFLLTISTTLLIFTDAINVNTYNKIEFILVSVWYSTLTLISGMDLKHETN